MADTAKLKSMLFSRYSKDEFPALLQQINKWSISKPLKNMRILDATPVFFNTGLKYLALLCGGAELTVSTPDELPKDERAVEFFRECGIKIASGRDKLEKSYDCICDCAGMHRDIESNSGVVELTGSGAHAYKNWHAPVFLADGGAVKLLETGLGTGNGLLRALLKLNVGSPAGKNILIFGGGKVGSGTALALCGAGGHCTIVDTPARVKCRADKVDITDICDHEQISSKISSSWAIITATGVKNAVSMWYRNFLDSDALLINIGVEDEYGENVPESRVLNRKMPLNFILDEPTLLRYIDPTMALSNIGAVELLKGSYDNGINIPPAEIEQNLLKVLKKGSVAPELSKLKEFFL